jgi:hypothetical protein
MTLSITKLCQYAECHCAECLDLFIHMLNVVMLSDIMLSVVRLNVVMLSVVTPYFSQMRLKKVAVDKHSSLFGGSVGDG